MVNEPATALQEAPGQEQENAYGYQSADDSRERVATTAREKARIVLGPSCSSFVRRTRLCLFVRVRVRVRVLVLVLDTRLNSGR